MKQTDTIYLIARPINDTSLNGNEYLLDKNNKPLEFVTYDECLYHCKSIGLDDSYVWSKEVEDKQIQQA